MTGIVIAGTGIGSLIAPPVISRLITIYDWRFSCIILGSMVLLVMVFTAQFLSRDPTQKGQLPYGESDGIQQGLESTTKTFPLKEAVYTMQFWLFFIMFFCFGFCFVAIIVHIVPYAIELGISTVNAANILASIGGIGIIGNLVLGSLGDRIGNRQVYIIGFILTSAALFWLVFAKELWMIFLFAGVIGFAQGGVAAQGPPLLASLFGLDSHGLLLGVVPIGFRIGAAIGPFVTGYIFDSTGSYQVAFVVCTSLSVASLLLTVTLSPTRRLGGRI